MDNTYNTFDEIEHTPLRTFNRVVMMTNLLADFGKEVARDYVAQFDETVRKQMYMMQLFIDNQGWEKARKASTKGLELPTEEDNNDSRS